MTSRLTVVIPTWNHSDLLGECLSSLRGQSFQDFDVLVVDDGSSDNIAGLVASDFPEVRVLRLPENKGFAAAVNAGLREVQTELVFLLNNDMTLDPACLAKLAGAAMDGGPALIAPLVLWRDDPETIYSAGDLQRANGRPESVGFRCPLAGFEFPETVFGVSAGAGLYRREVFDRVGLFDERFIAYFEDSDLNFRARLAGFSAICVPEAVAYHVGSASLGGRTWWRAKQCYRNHSLLVLKNMPLGLLFRYGPAIFREWIHQIRRAVSAGRAEYGLLASWAGVKLTTFGLLMLIPHALFERWRIRKLTTISTKELEALLTGPGKTEPELDRSPTDG